MKTTLRLKSLLFILIGIGLSFSNFAQVYQYTDNSSGTPFAVNSNATGGNLTRGVGLNNTSLTCTGSTEGFGAKDFSTLTASSIGSADASGDFVSFTITPKTGYRLNITGFSAFLRAPSSPSGGPSSVRYSYTIGGGNFVENGVSLTLGTSATCSNVGIQRDWASFTPVVTTQTVTFKIYGFNASAAGELYLRTITVAGTVECDSAIFASISPISPAICANNTVTLTGSTSGASVPTLTHAWTILGGGTGTGSLSSPTTNTNNLFTGLTGGTVNVQYIASYGACNVVSPMKVVTVNGLPTITLGANPAVCFGTTSASLTYSATTNSPNVYTINYDPTANAAGFADVSNQTLTASSISIPTSGIAAGTYNATLIVENQTTGCASQVYSFMVTVHALPVVSITGSTSVCVGSTIPLTGNSSPAAVTSSWASSASAVATVSSVGVVSGVAVGNSDITFTSTDANGCTKTTIPFNVVVNPIPTGTLTFTETSGTTNNDGTVCSGDAVNFTAPSGHANYNFKIDGDSKQTGSSNTYSASFTTSGSVTVEITGANTCIATLAPIAITVGTCGVHNITTNKYFVTIQAGVNAASTVNGNTLEVASGTYNEQILVNKELIIKGVGLTKPIVNFTGTPTGKLTLFDVSKPNVTIENFSLSVDVTKLGSAVLGSDATLSALTVKDNSINPYRTIIGTTVSFGLRNAISINYGAYRINGNNPIGLLIQGNTVLYNNGVDTNPGTADDAGFRAGVASDVGVGTFTGNTFQTINQDTELRFANPGSLIVTNNNFNGGGLEISEHNSATGVVTVSGNTFAGAGAPNTATLRLKNNQVQKPTTVSGNTFTNTVWAASLENYRDVTFNNNTFTPLSGSTAYQHIVVNTKIFSSGSAANVQTAIDGTFTNNTFNGSGATGGKAMVFNNHHSTAATFGTFTLGTAGNENNFNTGIQNFIFFDGSTGSSPGPTPATPMAPWSQNLDATFNKFDVSGSLKLPSAMTFAERTTLENALTHKPDNAALGIISYFKPVHNITQNTYFSTIQPAIAAAVTNNVIELSEWTFAEGITIDKPLTIQGVDSSSVILDGATIADANGITLANGVQNIIIKNLKIKNFKGANPLGSGIFGIENSNLMIDAVVMDNNQGRGGIVLGGGSNIQNVTIKNSISKNNIVSGSRGIVIWDGFKQNITITGNKVYGNNCCGIELQDGSATGVTVTGNTVFSNFDNGIGLIGLTGPGANIVSGNIVTNNGRFGMEIKNPNGNGLSSGAGSVVIDGNTVSRTIPIVDAKDIAGIAVFRRGVTALNIDVPQGVVVKNNTVSGYTQTSTSEGFGIVVEGINHTVATNTVSGNDVGIQRQAGHTPYPGDGNQTDVVDTYFGRGNSPVSCGITLTGNILSTNGINTRDVGNSDRTEVVTNANTNKPFCTIQSAINDVATLNGHTITATAGTYAEDIKVTKSVEIRGPNYGISPNGGTRVAEAILHPGTSGSDGVFVIEASNVKIDGFLLDGDNPNITSGWIGTNGADIDAYDGIVHYDVANTITVNNLKVQNNIIQNIQYFGVDIYGWDNFGNPASTGHLVDNNLFRNLGTYAAGNGYDKWGGGVLLYNNNYAAITNNVMTNVRTGIQTGNFSQANPGTVASQLMNNNTMQVRRVGVFHNLHYSSTSPYTLSNNTITGLANANETGVRGILLGSLSVNSTLNNNNIDLTGVSVTSTGIEVWNVKNTTPASIIGGTISNVNTGIFVNNYDGYNSNATDGGHATISGVTINPNSSGTGIRLFDNPLSTHVGVEATIGSGITINNGTNGIVVENTSAKVLSPLGNVAFVGQSGDYIKLISNANDMDGGLPTFGGVLASAMTQPQRVTLEGKLTHKFDTPALGKICLPTLGILSSSLTAVCVGGSANLSVAITSATGPFTVVYTDGTTPVTVNSYTSGTNIPITVSATKTYSIVSITDAIGCVSTTGFTGTPTITVNPLPTATISGTTAVCKNATAPNVTFTGADGTAPYTFTYKINGGADLTVTTTSGNSITVAAPTATAGSFVYTLVSVLDASTTLCSQAQTGLATVTVNELPTVGAGADVAICIGGSTTLTASGASTYTWSPATGLSATTGASITANPTATTTYTLTGTDANGCVDTDQVVVTVNALPTVSGGSDVAICIGGSTTLTASGASTYTWSPATGLNATTGTAVTANPTATTTYTVTGTDANGCVNTDQVVVAVNALPTVSAGSDVTICTGSSTTLTASGASTYTWSPATGLSVTTGTTVTANPTATITYTVTGTDANGCVNTDQVDVTVNSLPTIGAGSNVAICSGGSTTLTATGATSYTWSPATGLSATSGSPVTANPTVTTTYTVTGTDGNSCTNTAQVTVTVNPLPTFTTTFTNPSCNGATNGSITVTTSATSPMFSKDGGTTYVSGSSPYNFSTLAGTTYFIRVKDANSCASGSTSVTLTQPVSIVVTALPTAALCFGGNGSAAMSATGGNNTYTFTSSPIAGTISGGTLTAPAGSYTITATDGNGCTGVSGSITIGQPAVALSATTSKVNVLCKGGATGTATVLATGGTIGAGYTYSWNTSPVQTTATATGLIAGFYTVTVTDANGCTFSPAAVMITEPTLATSITASSTSPVCEASALNLTSTPTSSTGGLTYVWTGPNTFTASTQNASIATTTLLSAGNYTVTVTDGNSCVASAMTTVVINPLPSAYTVTGTGQICNGIAAPIILSGSQTGINYKLETVTFAYSGSVISGNGSALTFIPPSTPTGIYTIKATNTVTGCVKVMTGSVATTISTNPTLTILTQTDVSCFGGNDGTVTVVASSGTGSYNYAFNGGTSQLDNGVLTGKSAGTFPITATDANTGCVGTINVTLNQPTSLPSATVASSGIACVGNTVTLTATATGGTGTFTYNWNGTGFVSSNTLAVTTSGVNTLVVKDANGCISTATVSTTVTFNALPAPTIAGTTTVCSGATIGLMANDGVTYLWSGPGTFTSTTAVISIPNAQAANAGVYSVMVTNANSCVASAVATVTVNPTPAIPTLSATAASCSAAGTSTISNYDAANTYTFSPTGPTVVAGGVISGMTTVTSYTVTATNVATCVSVASATFSNAAQLATPAIPTLSATAATCAVAGTSTISNYDAGNTYTFSPTGPIVGSGGVISGMTVATSYTVTATNVASCISAASASFSNAAILPTPAVPNVSSTPATCTASGTSTIANYLATQTYIFTSSGPAAGAGGVISGTILGAIYTVKASDGTCTSIASATFSNDAILQTPAVPTLSSIDPSCSAAGTSTISNYIATGITYTFSPSGPAVGALGVISGMTIGTSYTVTATNVSTCISVASASFSNAAQLAAPNVSITNTGLVLTCTTPTTTVTASGAATYAWTGDGGFTASTATANILAGGTYTVIGTNANGCTALASVTVMEDKTPQTITVSAGTSILNCLTPSTTITASGANTYAWTGTGGFTASTAVATITAGGTYTVIGTNINGCTATARLVIGESKTNPTITVTPTTAILTCLTPSTTITASGATSSYEWSGTGGFTASTAIATITAGGTYTVIGTNGNGCTASASVVITENKTTPTVTVTPTTATINCTTPTTSILASGADTYSWTGTGGFTASTASATITAGGTYTVVGTSTASGCTASASVVITENKTTPTVNVTPTTALLTCTNPTTSILASGADIYSWTGTGGFTASTASATIAAGGTYTVVGTSTANGCTASASVVITEDKVTPIVTVSSASATINCTTPTTNIVASGADTYSWTGTGGFTASTASATITAGGTYTVVGTSTASGCTASASVVITENKTTPTVTVTPTTANINCTTPTTSILASGSDTYSWTGTGGFTASTASATITAGGTYTVVGTSTASGCTTSASVVITENKTTPTVAVTPTTATINCTTPTTNIVASGADTYSWTGTGGFTASTASATITAGGTYTVIGISTASGCTASASVVITENKITPTVAVTPTTALLTCANPTTALTASGSSTYLWSGPNGFTASTAIATISVGGTYIVVGTSAGGCTASASVVITENKVLPTVTVTGSATVCTGETLNLTATGGGTYAWVGPNAFNATTATISLPFAVIAYSGTYTVTVTNANGCTVNATSLVTVNAVPITPTVQANVSISPGSDITLTATGCAGTLLWFKSSDNSSVTMPVSPAVTTTYYAKCSVTANSVTCIGQASGTVTVTVGSLEIISIKTGNWEDPTTWNVGRLPLVSEDVTIDTSHIVTITTPTQATAKKLIYKTGATLNFGNTTAKLTLGSL